MKMEVNLKRQVFIAYFKIKGNKIKLSLCFF